MSRILVSLGIIAALAPVSLKAAEEESGPEKVLIDKGLRRSGAQYLLRDEDEVKKASDAAEAKLRAYRRAVMWEKDAARSEKDKKALLATLKRQESAMRQQVSSTVPALRAQSRQLSQQLSAMRQQMDTLYAAAQYNSNIGAGIQYRQMSNVYNNMVDQSNALTDQGNQMVREHNALIDRIEWLEGKSDESKLSKDDPSAKSASPAESREEYLAALGEAKKLAEQATAKYKALADDAEVKAALATLSKKSEKIKYTLGPSRKFQDLAKAIDQAEERAASGSIDAPEPVAKKAKKARR